MLRYIISPRLKSESKEKNVKRNLKDREESNKSYENHLNNFFAHKRIKDQSSDWHKQFLHGDFKSNILSPSSKTDASFISYTKRAVDSVELKTSKPSNNNASVGKITPSVTAVVKTTPNPTDTTFDNSTSPDTKRISSRNQNRPHKRRAFEDLISMFSNSSSKKPVKLFENNSFCDTSGRSNSKERTTQVINLGSFRVDEFNVSQEKSEPNVVQILSVIPTLLRTAKMYTKQMLIQDFYQDVPQIKDIDWSSIISKMGLKKIEFNLIDMIKFTVEAVFEINTADPKVQEKVNFCLKEASTYLNEAKQVLIYVYDQNDQKRLLLSKYLFLVKSNRNFPKGFKDEKDVMVYYQIILGILDFRFKTEANPLCTSIPKLRDLSLKYLNKEIRFQPYINEWFRGRISSCFYIEKQYFYPNPRGKDATIFEFNIKEYFALKYTEKKSNLTPIRLSTITNEHEHSKSDKTLFRSETQKQLMTQKSDNFIRLSQIVSKNAQIFQIVPNKIDLEIGEQPSLSISQNHMNHKMKPPDVYRTPSDLSIIDYDSGATREVLDESKLQPKRSASRSGSKLRVKKVISTKPDFMKLNLKFPDLKLPVFDAQTLRNFAKILSPTAH